MEKKTIVSAALLILATATILWMNQPSETKESSPQSSTTIQKKVNDGAISSVGCSQ